ncbi:MAG: hypothetical protein ACPLN0_03210 [Candidatus Hydrothermia bacterium]
MGVAYFVSRISPFILKGGALYLVEAYINSEGSLSWGEPVVVSDVNYYASYVLRDYMTFLPRLAM